MGRPSLDFLDHRGRAVVRGFAKWLRFNDAGVADG